MMEIEIMNEINLKDIEWTEYFKTQKIIKRKYEITVIINNEKDGLLFQKTKDENSIKIFLVKHNLPDMMLRSVMICYGSENEKEIFSKSFNKLYFNNKEELDNILKFIQKKYDFLLMKYFESDNMYQEIIKYCKTQIEEPFDKSIDAVQKKIIETMAFSKRIKFTTEGNIFLQNI